MAEENRGVDAVRDLLLGSDVPGEEYPQPGQEGAPLVSEDSGELLYYDENDELVDEHGNPLVMGSDGVMRTAAQAVAQHRAAADAELATSYTEEFDVRDNFAEYAFARSIERHNIWVMNHPEAGGRYVTVRQGRELHRQVEDILVAKFGPDSKKKPGLDMSKPVLGQVSHDELAIALGRAFSVPMSENPLWHVPETNGTERAVAASRRRAEVEDLKKDYLVAVTGAEYGPDSKPPFDLETGKVTVGNAREMDGFMVPLSPYAQEFQDAGSFRANGGRILYVPVNNMNNVPEGVVGGTLELESVGEGFNSAGFLSVGADGTVRRMPAGAPARNTMSLLRMDGCEADRLWVDTGDGMATPPDGIRKASPAGLMVSDSDEAGLSLLRDYMTPGEYRDAQSWITAYRDADGHPGTVSPKMASMALAVCEELRNRGFEFSIERDRQPGQLKAKLRGSMREVRLTDLSELGGYYVGRVYEGGNYMYVRTPAKTKDGTYREEPYFDERTAVTSLLAGLGLPTARVGWDLYPGKDGLYSRIIERTPEGDRFTRVGEIGHAYTAREGVTRRMSFWTVNPKTGGGRMSAWAGVSTRRNGRGSELMLLTENERQAAHLEFNDDEPGTEGGKTAREKAAGFLQASVRSAKLNFSRLMQADELIALAAEEMARHEAEPEDAKTPIADVPALSDNPSVAAVQKEYWEYLTGQRDELKIPGPDDEALAMLTESAAEASEDYDPEADDLEEGATASAVPSGTYDVDAPEFGGDRAAVVRRHLSDALDYKFGGLTATEDSAVDLSPDDASWKGFCPSLVAVYMRSGYGPVRNKADMVEAMRALDFTGEEFQKTDAAGNVVAKYDDFDSLAIKDRLLKFSPEKSRSLTGEDVQVSPFMATVRDAVLSSLRRNGCLVDGKDPDSVRIDENGVIHYKAYMMFGSTPSPNEKQMFREANMNRTGAPVAADYSDVRTDWIKDAYTIPVEGELGQIFEPDEDGLLETRYYGSRNKLMSPGYEAYVVMPKTGAATVENLPSRYRAKNLLSVLTENISSQIRIDLQNGQGFPRGLGELTDEDAARFLAADTEEARRALMAEFHIADSEHNSFATMETRELREDFLKVFRNNRYQWSSQMDAYMASDGSGVSAGTTTSLNYTYRRGIYSTPYKLLVEPLKDVVQPDGTVRDETLKEAYVRQQTQLLKYPVEAMKKAFKTNRDAVHFPKYLIDGSSVMEEYRHDEAVRKAAGEGPASVHDVTNDNSITAWMLTGGANMAIQMENSHIVLLDDKPLRTDMTLAAGSVLAGPVDVADKVLPAGQELAEPATVAAGGVLPAGTAISNFFRVAEVVMKKNAALPSDVVLPVNFDVPAGTVPGADMEINGTVYPAGAVLEAPVKTSAVGMRLPAGTVLPSDRKIAGTSFGRGSATKTDVPIQPGTVLPAGMVPAGDVAGCLRQIPAGVPLEEDTTFPAGTVFPKGFRMRVFDAAYTGSGKNQGGTRYLVVGAGITGVEPVSGPDDPRLASGELSGPNDPMAAGSTFTGSLNDDVSCELIQDNPDMPYAQNQPADRIQMTVSNYHTGLSIAGTRFERPEGAPEPEYPEGHDYSHGVRVAQVTAGGFTFDDGCVYGDKFAHYFQVIGEDGKLRDICPGDKGCNMAGDKHTYAIKYDPDMPLEEQKRLGVDKVFELFRLNPGLDLVMSPYSALTRFSAANAKIGMSNPEGYGPQDLILPEGCPAGEDDGTGKHVVKGGILTVPMVVTKQTAEEHVSGYDEEDVKHGLGRKVSAQMSWVLTSAGAENMMRCIYGPDAKSFMDTREYFITLGYDLGPTGQVLPGYKPHTAAEHRFLFDGPSAALVNTDQTGAQLSDTCRKLFGDVMDQKGGFMEVPFQLKFAGGSCVYDEKGRLTGLAPKYLEESRKNNGMYMLPVLSAHLRSGQEWQNGERKFHEYTNWYTKIYASGVEYLRERQRAGLKPGDPETPRMLEIKRDAQRSFDSIANDIVDRRIDTKYGFARGAMMTRRMPNSATAIWTANPTLAINEVALSVDLLPVLGLKLKTQQGPDGKAVPVLDKDGRMQLDCEAGDLAAKQLLVTRDPVIDRAGVRSLTIVPVAGAKGFPDPADPSKPVEGTVGKPGAQVRGVQVNPLIAATYKGDFDGDSVGLVRLKDKAALAEQYSLFSIEQNVLDMTKRRENGDYALLLNITMDAVSSEYFHPELTGRRMNLEHAANLVARGIRVERVEEPCEDGTTRAVWKQAKGTIDADERTELNQAIAADLSAYTREALALSVGTEAISFASLDEHMNSLKVPIQHGAKGKLGNLKVYGKYYGIEPETMAEGLADLKNAFKDLRETKGGRPAIVDDDMRDVECATAYKAYGTGNAGSIQQMVVAFARNVVLSAGDRVVFDADGKPAMDDKGRPLKMEDVDPVAARLSVLDAALYITQGATQGLLQAKHDPEKAKRFYAMINGPIPELFRGHKMNYNEKTGEWEQEFETDEKGRQWPARLTAGEWSAMAKKIFKDPVCGLGMEELNDEHFDILGQAAARMVKRGGKYREEVLDMSRTDQLMQIGASPMDICAYTTPKRKNTMQFLAELAYVEASLFSGNHGDGKGLQHSGGMSKLFMPDVVRQNEEALYGEHPDPSKVRAILPGDVKDRTKREKAAHTPAPAPEKAPAQKAAPEATVEEKAVDVAVEGLKQAEAEIAAMREAVAGTQNPAPRMNSVGTAGRDLVAARREVIERTGYRTELLDDGLGLISQDSVPVSAGVRDRRMALRNMEDYMHSKECIQRDVDFNRREAATVELAEQMLMDYVIDKGLSDWDVRLVTGKPGEGASLDSEQTFRAAALMEGLRADLLSQEARYGDDAGKRLAGEEDGRSVEKEARMASIRDKLRELDEMGYRQYMTAEADASYGDRCLGTAFVPGDGPRELSWFKEQQAREAAARVSDRDPEELARIEELKAAIPGVKDFYAAFEDVRTAYGSMDGLSDDDVLVRRGQMQDMTVAMAERLQVMYKIDHREDTPDVAVATYGTGDLPECEEGMGFAVTQTCESLAADVARMYEITLGDPDKAADASLDEERRELYGKLAKQVGDLNDFGFEHSAPADVEAPAPEEPSKAPVEPEKPAEKAGPTPEQEKPQGPDYGHMAVSTLQNLDGSSKTGEGVEGKDPKDTDITGQ